MMYIKHIQRPQLDLMNINNRFGYLCYQILKRGLRRPLVIKCFSQDLDQAVEWSEFMLAKGVIMDDVQQWEFEDPDSDRDARYWYGLDCRYNHLCLSNHTILANKIITAFETGTIAHVGEDIPSAELIALFNDIPALRAPVLVLTEGDESPAVLASAVEFVLEGLHLTRRLNKDASGTKATYRSRG